MPTGFAGSGGGIRTHDLQVMSLVSYLTALPRVVISKIGIWYMHCNEGFPAVGNRSARAAGSGLVELLARNHGAN